MVESSFVLKSLINMARGNMCYAEYLFQRVSIFLTGTITMLQHQQ